MASNTGYPLELSGELLINADAWALSGIPQIRISERDQGIKKTYLLSESELPKLRTPALNYFTPLECKYQETKEYSMGSSELTYNFTLAVIDLKRCW